MLLPELGSGSPLVDAESRFLVTKGECSVIVSAATAGPTDSPIEKSIGYPSECGGSGQRRVGFAPVRYEGEVRQRPKRRWEYPSKKIRPHVPNIDDNWNSTLRPIPSRFICQFNARIGTQYELRTRPG
jgi:hypothetical protein